MSVEPFHPDHDEVESATETVEMDWETLKARCLAPLDRHVEEARRLVPQIEVLRQTFVEWEDLDAKSTQILKAAGVALLGGDGPWPTGTRIQLYAAARRAVARFFADDPATAILASLLDPHDGSLWDRLRPQVARPHPTFLGNAWEAASKAVGAAMQRWGRLAGKEQLRNVTYELLSIAFQTHLPRQLRFARVAFRSSKKAMALENWIHLGVRHIARTEVQKAYFSSVSSSPLPNDPRDVRVVPVEDGNDQTAGHCFQDTYDRLVDSLRAEGLALDRYRDTQLEEDVFGMGHGGQGDVRAELRWCSFTYVLFFLHACRRDCENNNGRAQSRVLEALIQWIADALGVDARDNDDNERVDLGTLWKSGFIEGFVRPQDRKERFLAFMRKICPTRFEGNGRTVRGNPEQIAVLKQKFNEEQLRGFCEGSARRANAEVASWACENHGRKVFQGGRAIIHGLVPWRTTQVFLRFVD